jgi:hypothetical protein
MFDTALIPEKTIISSKGDGSATDVSSATNRIFLLTLNITAVVEQESLEVSIFGSEDGQSWPEKPLITFPQKFYCGESPLLLDLSSRPDVKFLRAHWEVNRWGRGKEEVMFEIGLKVREVPPEMLQR